MSQLETLNIRRRGVKQAWEGPHLRTCDHRKRTRLTKCVHAASKSLCGMCPANGEMENGDKESPVDFLCHVAHLRAAVVGSEVPAHGECDFCAGGSQYDVVIDSARRIVDKEIDVESWAGPQQILPVLNSSAVAGGCGGSLKFRVISCFGRAAGVAVRSLIMRCVLEVPMDQKMMEAESNERKAL